MNWFFERRRTCINDVRQRLYQVDYSEVMAGFARGDFDDIDEAIRFAGPAPEEATDEDVQAALVDDLKCAQRHRERGVHHIADYFEILTRAAFELPTPGAGERAMQLWLEHERTVDGGKASPWTLDAAEALRRAGEYHARMAA